MKNLKYVIIALGIILIALIVITIVIFSKKGNSEAMEPDQDESGIVIPYKTEVVKNATQYFTVSSCIQKYLDSVYKGEGIAVYNMLSKEFISANNVDDINSLNVVDKLENPSLFEAKKMNMIGGDFIETYSVYGLISNRDNPSLREEAYFLVTLDVSNLTFSVTPKEVSKLEDINLETGETEIKENDNNIFDYYRITKEELIRKYLANYKENVQYDVETAYNLINKEYSEKRFGSLDSFRTYTELNEQEIRGSLLDQYTIKEYDDYIQYICIDQNRNYYIINETAVMQYDIILDTYTLDLPEFLTKYNQTNNQGKVALNIQKFVDSINAKDYNYAYSKLADGFKNTNFPSLESFENYIKGTLYNKNEVEYMMFSEEADLYTYKISIMNAEETSGKPMEKTIIMKLGEGTEFVLSFDVN